MVVQRSSSNGRAELGWGLLLTTDQGLCSQPSTEGTTSPEGHLLWCFRGNLPAAVWDQPCWDLALQQAWPCSLSHICVGRWHHRCVLALCLTAGSAGPVGSWALGQVCTEGLGDCGICHASAFIGEQEKCKESLVWISVVSCLGRCWLWAAHVQPVKNCSQQVEGSTLFFPSIFTLFFIFRDPRVPEIVLLKPLGSSLIQRLEAKSALLVQNKTIATEAQGNRWERLSLVVLVYCSLAVVLFI